MTTTVNVQEAKTRLSELLRRVESGEEIVIARAGTPIATIQASIPLKRNLSSPLLPEIPPLAAEALFEDLSDDELSDWEDNRDGDPMLPTRRS